MERDEDQNMPIFCITEFFFQRKKTSCQILSHVSVGTPEFPTKLTWGPEVDRAGKSLSLRIAVPESYSIYHVWACGDS